MSSRRHDARRADGAVEEPTRGGAHRSQSMNPVQTNNAMTYGLVLAFGLIVLLMFGDIQGTKASQKIEKSASRAEQPSAEAPSCDSLGSIRLDRLKQASENIYLDTFDAVKHDERSEAIGQKGVTLWMTGLSGSGKSTIGKALEKRLVLEDGNHMYRLDGDNLRFGLSKDLRLGAEDRNEAVRRAYEVSLMMADSGVLSLVSLISPYRKDRDEARALHAKRGIAFLEVYVEAPIDEVKSRDPKGLYKMHEDGKIKGMTGLDAPYEAPTTPDVVLKTATCCGNDDARAKVDACKAEAAAADPPTKYHKHCPAVVDTCIDACVDVLRTTLIAGGFAKERPSMPPAMRVERTPENCPTADTGAHNAKIKKECIPEPASDSREARGHADGYPAGTTPMSLIEEDEAYWTSDAVTQLQPVPISDNDVQWTQVIGEGWAAPLRGPMREAALVQTLHFESMLFDPAESNGAGASGYGPGPAKTAFGEYEQNQGMVRDGVRVNMPVPIVISICKHSKMLIERKVKQAKGERVQVVLVSPSGEPVAVLNNPEVYDFRKEEMITRSWGSWDLEHPYIKANILDRGDYLVGGEFEKVRRIRYRDGLDAWRKTPQELLEEFKEKGSDAVYAFQTRNPTHAGHAHLMKDGRKQLIELGYSNPVLWLSPLGGWTKGDDVPLDIRVKQHQAVLDEKMLDPDWTVLSIWPSPMVYSGPTEVQWHAKSRRVAGADYFIVGRDPAGLSYSEWHKEKGEDVYHADHGRYVLQMSPGMGRMGLVSSGAVHYDKTDGEMKPMPSGMSKEEFSKRFLKISGSKMRKMGKMKVDVCESLDAIPSDWADTPSCVPPKFMVPTGWEIMKNYYVHKDDADVIANAIVYSKQRPEVAKNAETAYPTKVGLEGNEYAVYLKDAEGKRISPWHDVPLRTSANEVNMVVEFPKGTNAKFEVQKDLPYNPIKQDTKKGKPRYYTYGLSFFNNGLVPQTWEDSSLKDDAGYLGDNDPLDIMEVGSISYPMGSVVPVKILGSIGMIDSGETDHKVIAIAVDDPEAEMINSLSDLVNVRGEEMLTRIREWLRRYKTTDKDDPDEAKLNEFLDEEKFQSVEYASELIDATNKRWQLLREGKADQTEKTKDFWLRPEGAAEEFKDALKLAER